nr:hypothetical protein [Tanacetum cinerariifolium]
VAPPAAPSQPHLATAIPHATATIPTKVVKDELVPTKPQEIEIAPVAAELSSSEISTTDATSTGMLGGTGTAETGSTTETSSGTAPAITGP